MFKVAYVARFKPGLPREDARTYWTNVHAPMADPLTDMQIYIQSHAIDGIDPLGSGPDTVTFHGYSCEWWTDRARFDAGMATKLWEEIVDDGIHVFDMSSMDGMSAVLEQTDAVAGERTAFKVAEFVRWRDDVGREAAEAQWRDGQKALAARVPGLRRQWQNLVVGSIGMEGVVDERAAFDGLSEWWFDDADAFATARASPEWAALREARAAFVDPDQLTDYRGVVEERVIREP